MTRAPVSVVIPTYNTGHLVGEAIDSVLAQTVAPFEVIVVDDGSVDGTGERLVAYGSRVRYVFQENQGVAAARNLGVRLATSELIAFLDADDVWHPRKLELQLAAMAENPALGILGTQYFAWPAPAFPKVEGPDRAAVVEVPWVRLAVRNQFGTSSILCPRSILARVGPFDTNLQGPEDYDLWLRIAEAAPVANLELPLMGYRTVPGSLCKRATAMHTGMTRILRKLDEREAWKGRRLLRRKAHSYAHYASSYLYREAGSPATALRRLLSSFLWYPLPYRRSEVRMPLARPKMLCISLLHLLRIARSEPSVQPQCAADLPSTAPAPKWSRA